MGFNGRFPFMRISASTLMHSNYITLQLTVLNFCFLFPFTIKIYLENVKVLDSAIIAQKNMFHYEILLLFSPSLFNCHLTL